jgi:A/G-specific adenine glycosylase
MQKDKNIRVEIGDKTIAEAFVKGLLSWNKRDNRRRMPWKGEKNPYRIWLSEIILQQTRVEQGLGYYTRFIEAYPTIHDLAEAPEQEVFKLWEGLGYYSRCKNLIVTAKYISNELNGVFPIEYQQILELKGVGNYTAAAIVSFAYNHAFAVVDGNVIRVLSRIFNIDIPIDISKGKKLLSSLAQAVLPFNKAGVYNQAIMDFGATICKPLPECGNCFFNTYCRAFLQGKQLLLPVKSKKISIRERWFNYIILKHQTKYAIRQRTDKDIWQNLFEFLLIETNKKTSSKKVLLSFEKNFGPKQNQLQIEDHTFQFKQRLSHQIIHFQFIKAITLKKLPLPESILWVEITELKNYPFPKTLQQYIRSQF